MTGKKIVIIATGLLVAGALFFFIDWLHHHEEGHDHKADLHHGHNHGLNKDDDHDLHREGSAVQDLCEEDGLLLSPEALQTIGLQTMEISGSDKNPVTVANEALVFYKEMTVIYVLAEKRFKEREIRVIKQGSRTSEIVIPGLKGRVTIAAEGADLLRLAFLEASGATGTGHIH